MNKFYSFYFQIAFIILPCYGQEQTTPLCRYRDERWLSPSAFKQYACCMCYQYVFVLIPGSQVGASQCNPMTWMIGKPSTVSFHCDRHIRVRFPALAVISDLVLVHYSLTRSLRNGTHYTRGPLCVCTSHMQFKDPPLLLHNEKGDTWVLSLTLYSREDNSLRIEDMKWDTCPALTST